MSEAALDQFHFLRPFWLLLVPLAIWVHLRLRRSFSASTQWQSVIPEHLLKHLVVSGRNRKRVRPYHLFTSSIILAALALAGPAWERQVTPFTQDKAPLIIALKLTPTMLSTDQAPTRLERAKQKIQDILDRRKGARTAVIAYAGSAHAVLPLTDDSQLIELYLASLFPSLMPREGDEAGAALELAQKMLTRANGGSENGGGVENSESSEDTNGAEDGDSIAGTVLFMTDGIDRTLAGDFSSFKTSLGSQILFLAFGTNNGGPISEDGAGGQTFGLVDGAAPGVDLGGLSAVADAVGSSVIQATPGLEDVNTLVTQIQIHLVDAVQQDDRLQWRDFGYVLVWPLCFLVLLWWRRGWTVNWA